MMQPQSEPPSIKVEVPPYGAMDVFAPDDQQELLQSVERNWGELWPHMRGRLQARRMLPEAEQSAQWMAAIQRVEPGVFMSDKADLLFSISFGEKMPQWDFFIRGGKIVHSQPVH